MNEKPYIITTSRKYTVDLPDCDNDIEISWSGETERIYLSKEDVLKLLERFN